MLPTRFLLVDAKPTSRSTANGGQQDMRKVGRIPGRESSSSGDKSRMSLLSRIARSTFAVA